MQKFKEDGHPRQTNDREYNKDVRLMSKTEQKINTQKNQTNTQHKKTLLLI